MGTLIKQWKTMPMPENATVGRNETVTWIIKGTKRTGKLSKSGKVNVQSENWTAQFTDETGTVRRVPEPSRIFSKRLDARFRRTLAYHSSVLGRRDGRENKSRYDVCYAEQSQPKSSATTCYAGFIDDVPVCFAGIVHSVKKSYRISRLVVLPDYQGIGIAGRFMNSVSGIYTRQGLRIRIGTAHPSMVAMLSRSNEWRRVAVQRPDRVPMQRCKVGKYRTIFNYEHVG